MVQQSNSGPGNNQADNNRHDSRASSDPGYAGTARYQQPGITAKGSRTLSWQGREPDLKEDGYYRGRGSEMFGCGGNDAEGNY